MVKRIRLWGILLCASLICNLCGAAVLAATETSVTNPFSTGVVNIDLKEYTVKDGTEKVWRDVAEVLPGAQISKVPRISNLGVDCYVRAKLTWDGASDGCGIYGLGDGWVLADDGYYYYTEVLPEGGSTDMFEGVSIPEDLDESVSGEEFSLRVDVDAIQSRNFTPSFTSSDPWGSVEVLEYTKGEDYDLAAFKKADTQSFDVTYDGDVIAASGDDFFQNIPVILPGDSYTDEVTIRNTGDGEADIYFRTERVSDSSLLEKVTLKVWMGDELIYDGALHGDSLNGGILLTTLAGGGEGTFRFTVDVPAELNNGYTLLSGKVKWIFSAEDADPDRGGTDRTDDSSSDSTSTEDVGSSGSGSSGVSAIADAVQTGVCDNAAYLFFVAGAVFLVSAAVCRKRQYRA